MGVDPNHPNVKHIAAVISEMNWQYLTTHTAEEIEEMKRRVERDREMRRRLFGSTIKYPALDVGD